MVGKATKNVELGHMFTRCPITSRRLWNYRPFRWRFQLSSSLCGCVRAWEGITIGGKGGETSIPRRRLLRWGSISGSPLMQQSLRRTDRRWVSVKVWEYEYSIKNHASGHFPNHCSACTCKQCCKPLFKQVKMCRWKDSRAREIREFYHIRKKASNCVSDTSIGLHNSEFVFIQNLLWMSSPQVCRYGFLRMKNSLCVSGRNKVSCRSAPVLVFFSLCGVFLGAVYTASVVYSSTAC